MDGRIEKVLDYIESHLAENLNLSRLAEMGCMSESQFHRTFKKLTGFTPFKFIEKMRLKFAHQQLIHEPQNIQQLSEQCGYKDYETFSRAFKKLYCLSPHDLAAITEQIRQAHESHDGIYVAAMAEYDIESIQKKFDELIDELQLSNRQVKESTVLTVDKVSNSDEIDSRDQLVKNKYRVAKDEKLWQLLIESR